MVARNGFTRGLRQVVLMAAVGGLVACAGGGTDSADPDTDTDGSSDSQDQVVELPAGPLMAGFAEQRMPVPLGIGTAGFNGIFEPGPDSPFADLFPATQHIYGHPNIKVTAVSRGEGHEAIWVRLDMIGVFAQLRNDVVARASAVVGRDLDDAVMINATHTHAGPGRVVDKTGAFGLLVDTFFPAFYDRLVQSIADTIVLAVDDLAPARLATGTGTSEAAHNDRRCEDGVTYTNDTVQLVAIERDGEIQGLVYGYAIHGTVFGISSLHLSQDVSGGMEQWVADGFDHPVHVQFVNTWAGDVAPSNPAVDTVVVDTRDERGDYAQVHNVGKVFADDVHRDLAGLTFEDEPTVTLQTVRVPIDRERMGYEDDEFPYEYGASQCQGPESCDEPVYNDNRDNACFGFLKDGAAPDRTTITVGQIGSFAVVTSPTEPVTSLAEAIMDGMMAQPGVAEEGVQDVFFMGYSQDYLGYALLAEDWYLGGYESEGTLWGPKIGDYLLDRSVAAYAAWRDRTSLDDTVDPLPVFELPADLSFTPDISYLPGTIFTDVPSAITHEEALSFSVAGGDPWYGAPTLALVDAKGDPVLRPNGTPITGDSAFFDLSVEVDPTYDDAPDVNARTFTWTWRMSARSHVVGGIDLTGGTYKLVATLPDANDASFTAESGSFEVLDLGK